MIYRYRSRIAILLLVIILICTVGACGRTGKQERLQNSFDQFMTELFVNEVQSDSLSLNYSLANPENFGIHYKNATLGEYSAEQISKEMFNFENCISRLNSFDYYSLTPEQRLTYDIVKEYYQSYLNLGTFTYYNECLGPTTGFQAQLPILLAEYSFHDREAIDEYLQLLPCVYDYFESIANFEREKSKRGLFMNDRVALRIIEQCKTFIEKPSKNFLIEYFNEKIEAFPGLSKKEVAAYSEANKSAVLNYVIPAYKLLIGTMEELLGTGTNNAGLYYYPEGQAYYESLAKYKTGSGRDMEGMIALLDNAINKGVINITTLTLSDPNIMKKYMDFTSFPITSPEEILDDLKDEIERDFPKAVEADCKIKYVPESLSQYLSPAMYLVPPIDSYLDNNIYINGRDPQTLSMIYTTIAHEGYPGHLYQCVYFRNSDPSPIRSVLNFAGYDEGWATYVEFLSYHMAGIDENLASFLAANNIVILCMYARCDIGIHYEGWTKDEVTEYILNFIDDQEVAELIYNTLLEEPAIYLPYAVGYLEIMELRNKAEEALGERFVSRDFHKFILDIGPAPFGVIEKYLNLWIERRIK